MVEGPIPREHYLNLLRSSRDVPMIKVLTGMRRCGKSTLMSMFREELLESGVPQDKILYINLDDETDRSIDTHRKLIDAVKEALRPGRGTYLFFDEVQNVPEWERAVESFHISGADVYVTGSNSQMLSSEIATKLSGRCIEIPVYPLSFREYTEFRKTIGDETRAIDALFADYMRRGGLPAVALMEGGRRDLISLMLSGTYNTVYVKDVVERNEIRNAPLLSNISRFLMKNVGDRTSVRNVTNYLVSKGMKTSTETVNNYISALESALLFHRAKRFDVKTKEYLRTSDKFYVSDLGIRNNEVGFHDRDLDGMLENVVYMELIRRHGNVSVCAVDGNEVDFMVSGAGGTAYYQVTMSIIDPATRERELRSLKAIADNYPKTIVTMDRYPIDDIEGTRIVNIVDFLMEQ